MIKIGLMLEKINTFTHTPGIYGDEIWANALCKGLNAIEGVEARTYGENMGYMPEVDIAIYFYFFKGTPKGKKNIFIFQNFTDNENHVFNTKARMEWVKTKNFDKIFTISKKYSEEYNWALLYPCVDMDFFKPQKENPKYKFELAYIGNNIKDQKKTEDWLKITGIKYGIFGNGFNKPISHIESLRVFSNSVNLNFGFDTKKEILTARIFQISACKGTVICEYLKSYKDIFQDNMYFVYDDPQREIRQILRNLVSAQNRNGYEVVKNDFNCYKQGKILYDLITDNILAWHPTALTTDSINNLKAL